MIQRPWPIMSKESQLSSVSPGFDAINDTEP